MKYDTADIGKFLPDDVSVEDFDIIVYTDGGACGVKDYGGSASRVVSEMFDLDITTVTAACYTGTYRAEFVALLDALHAIVLEIGYKETEKSMAKLLTHNGGFKLRVLWVGDNKTLITGVNDPQKLKAEFPLIKMLEVYLNYFDILGVFTPRNVIIAQEETDALASGVRAELKRWLNHILESERMITCATQTQFLIPKAPVFSANKRKFVQRPSK